MSIGIVCPYCNYDHEEYWEYIDPLKDEDEFKMGCENCDKEFNASYYTTISFESTIKEESE